MPMDWAGLVMTSASGSLPSQRRAMRRTTSCSVMMPVSLPSPSVIRAEERFSAAMRPIISATHASQPMITGLVRR